MEQHSKCLLTSTKVGTDTDDIVVIFVCPKRLDRGGAAAGLESPCMEEGLQQDSGAPVLPCTVSCVFFQKTLRGWLGSTQAKDMVQNTAPGIRGKAVTISQRIGVRLFKGKKIYFT